MGEQVVWAAMRVTFPPEMLGIFSEEQKAVEACRQPIDVVGPLVVDEALPDETHLWVGAYYPLANYAAASRNTL